MECERIREILEPYAAGLASTEEIALAEAHLRACPGCARELRWIRALKASVRAVPRPAMPADLRAALLRRALGRGPAWRDWLDALRDSRRVTLGFGFASAFAAAAGMLAFNHFFSASNEELSLDEALAAHGRYELTMPAADREAIYADLGLRLAGGGDQDD